MNGNQAVLPTNFVLQKPVIGDVKLSDKRTDYTQLSGGHR